MGTYSVSIRQDGVIVVIDPTTMKLEVAKRLANSIDRRCQEMRLKGRDVLILVDSRPLKEAPGPVNKYMVERTLNMDFDRMAVFGARPLQTKAANLMLMAGHLLKRESPIDKIKLFASQEAAERWLKDYSHMDLNLC
jgi:hypothetical protein